MLTLDDQFGIRKGIVMPGMVQVEMVADQDIDVIGAQAEIDQVRDNILPIAGRRRPAGSGISMGQVNKAAD